MVRHGMRVAMAGVGIRQCGVLGGYFIFFVFRFVLSEILANFVG